MGDAKEALALSTSDLRKSPLVTIVIAIMAPTAKGHFWETREDVCIEMNEPACKGIGEDDGVTGKGVCSAIKLAGFISKAPGQRIG